MFDTIIGAWCCALCSDIVLKTSCLIRLSAHDCALCSDIVLKTSCSIRLSAHVCALCSDNVLKTSCSILKSASDFAHSILISSLKRQVDTNIGILILLAKSISDFRQYSIKHFRFPSIRASKSPSNKQKSDKNSHK